MQKSITVTHHGQLTPEHENREKKLRGDERGRGEIRKYSLNLSTTGTITLSCPTKCSQIVIVCVRHREYITRENENSVKLLRDILSIVSTFMMGSDNLDHLRVLTLCI